LAALESFAALNKVVLPSRKAFICMTSEKVSIALLTDIGVENRPLKINIAGCIKLINVVPEKDKAVAVISCVMAHEMISEGC
jgi:hypothetical protein